MYNYIHACMHTYIHSYIHTYTHIYIHIYTSTYIHTYTHTYIQTNKHTYRQTDIHTYMFHYSQIYIKQFLVVRRPQSKQFSETSPVSPPFGASVSSRHLHPSGHLRRRRGRAPAAGCEERLWFRPRRGHRLWAVHLQRTTTEGREPEKDQWAIRNIHKNSGLSTYDWVIIFGEW